MSDKHTLSAVTAQLTVACNLASIYIVLGMREDFHTWFFPGALLLFAPLLYGLDRLFLRRERSLRALWLLNILAAAIFIVLCCWADGLSGVLHRLPMMVFFTGWLTFKAVNSALDGPSLNNMLLCLDGSILVLVLFSAYSAASGLELIWSIPAICGFASAMLGMTARRSSRSFGWKEWTFMAVAFCLIFGVMWLLVDLIAAPAGSGLVALWNALVQLASFIGYLVTRFVRFLASLFPSVPEDGELAVPAAPAITPEMAAGEGNPLLGTVVIVLLLAFAVFCVVQLIRKLGGRQVGGKAAKVNSVHRRARVSLKQGLQTLFAEWKQKLLLRKFLWTHRNTAVGLYFTLVRRCRLTPWHKLPGETPREFLTRLQRGIRSDLNVSSAIPRLISAVDAALYAGAPLSQPFAEAAWLRRNIPASLQRQAIQDGLHHKE